MHGIPASDFSFSRDCGILGRLLKGFEPEQVKGGIDALLRDKDRFAAENSWSLRLLPRRLSGYLSRPWWWGHYEDGEPFELVEGERPRHPAGTYRVRRHYGEIWSFWLKRRPMREGGQEYWKRHDRLSRE